MTAGKLYLIPSLLGDSEPSIVLPSHNLEIINHINHYIVEDIRTARRFLSKCGIKTKIDDLQFFLLNKFTTDAEIESFLKPLFLGYSMGVISEAGCPAVADPGAEVVRLAHLSDIKVVPLTGPSSILLALMASGLNGQKFAFNGYLPVKDNERLAQIKKDEQRSRAESQTQIYIETPYRNNQLFSALVNHLQPETMLTVASALSLENQQVKTLKVKDWKKVNFNLNKIPAIFLILA